MRGVLQGPTSVLGRLGLGFPPRAEGASGEIPLRPQTAIDWDSVWTRCLGEVVWRRDLRGLECLEAAPPASVPSVAERLRQVLLDLVRVGLEPDIERVIDALKLLSPRDREVELYLGECALAAQEGLCDEAWERVLALRPSNGARP